MSRGGYDDHDENFPNEQAFWDHRAKLARTSKRGRKALTELREALLALPERRLIEGALSTVRVEDRCVREYQRRSAIAKHREQGDGVCAVGAYIWHRRVKEGMTTDEAFDSLPVLLDSEGGLLETAEEGKAAGLTWTLAYILADYNDEVFAGMTTEERFEAFIKWIDRELAVSA